MIQGAFARAAQNCRSLNLAQNAARWVANVNKSTALNSIKDGLLTEINHMEIQRSYHKTSCLSLYKSPRNKYAHDPCKNQCEEEEEEQCTITPCCRPFRLLKEHPMKKFANKDAKCEKKEEKKPKKKPCS